MPVLQTLFGKNMQFRAESFGPTINDPPASVPNFTPFRHVLGGTDERSLEAAVVRTCLAHSGRMGILPPVDARIEVIPWHRTPILTFPLSAV